MGVESRTSHDPHLGGLQGQSGSWGAYTQVHFQVQFSGEPKLLEMFPSDPVKN